MPVFKLFAIICAVAVPRADCSLDVHNDPRVAVYELPLTDEDQTNLGCLRRSMFSMAPLAIAPHEGEYMKSVCVRMEPETHAAK